MRTELDGVSTNRRCIKHAILVHPVVVVPHAHHLNLRWERLAWAHCEARSRFAATRLTRSLDQRAPQLLEEEDPRRTPCQRGSNSAFNVLHDIINPPERRARLKHMLYGLDNPLRTLFPSRCSSQSFSEFSDEVSRHRRYDLLIKSRWGINNELQSTIIACSARLCIDLDEDLNQFFLGGVCSDRPDCLDQRMNLLVIDQLQQKAAQRGMCGIIAIRLELDGRNDLALALVRNMQP